MRRLTPLLLILLLTFTLAISVSAQDATPEPTDTIDMDAEATAEGDEMDTDMDADGEEAEIVDPEDANYATASDVQAPATYVRFVNLAEVLNSVDVFVNAEAINASDLTYEEFSVWTAIAAGELDISASETGQPAEAAAVGPVNVNLAENTWNTVLIVPNAENQPTAVTIQEDFASIAPTVSTVYFVNALPDTTVNFLRDEIPFYTGLGNAANGDVTQASLPVESRIYNFSVTNAADDTEIAEAMELELDAGKVYVMAVVGTADNARLVVDETSPAEARLRNNTLEAPGNLVQVAQGEPLLSPFVQLVQAAGLDETLATGGPYTIFAPADFVLDDVMASFDGDTEALRELLLNHVVEGEFDSGNLFLIEEGPYTSLAGNTLEITETEAGFINGERILAVDNYGVNGVIHLIDGLLETPGVTDPTDAEGEETEAMEATPSS